MKNHLASAPLLLPALFMILGIVLTGIVNYILLFISISLIICILFIFKFRYSAILSISTLFGVTCVFLYSEPKISFPTNQPISFSANILEAKETNAGQSLIVEITSMKTMQNKYEVKVLPTRVSILIPSLNPPALPGYSISATATFLKPDSVRYVPDQITIADRLSQQNINYTGILVPDSIHSIKPSEDFKMKLLRIRDSLTTYIFRSKFNPETKIFLNTLITGNQYLLDDETRNNFSQAGIAHFLALSGMHVGIFSAIFLIFLFPLRATRFSFYIPIIIIGFLWFFALITGLSVSVTRAVIMATVFLSAYLLQRPHHPMNSLSLASMLILTFDPFAIYEISFQLSFLAVLGIILFTVPLNPINPKRKILYYLISIITISISAMSFVGIITVYHFHSFPIFFLLSNILVTPLVPIFLFFGIIAILLSVVGFYPDFIFKIVDSLFFIIKNISDFFGTLPYGTINNIYITKLDLIIFVLIVLSVWFAIYKKNKFLFFVPITLTVVFILTVIFNKKNGASDNIFLIPSTSRTDLLIAKNKKLYIITDTHDADISMIEDELKYDLKDYIGKRGIDSVIIIPRYVSSKEVGYEPPLLSLPNGEIAFCSSNHDFTNLNREQFIDFMIICRGVTMEIDSILENYNIGTLILSKNMHPARVKHYMKRCKELNTTVISLRQQKTPDLNVLF